MANLMQASVMQGIGRTEFVDRVIRTGLCPGGNVRMSRLLKLIEHGRVDPSPLTTHQFDFQDVGKALHMMETKEDCMPKPLIRFSAS